MKTDHSGPINVGTGVGTTINNLARAVFEATGREVPIRHGRAREGEIRYSLADNRLAAQALGLGTYVGLGAGLAKLGLF
jgi:UDP-glucose 4-epimerase